MINLPNVILYFFAFFLVSRLFSEVFHILPKAVDILDIPFILFLIFHAIFKRKYNKLHSKEHRFVVTSIIILILIICLSIIFNLDQIFPPAAFLFAYGFLAGPLLFICLNMVIDDKEKFSVRLNRLLRRIFILNVLVVIFIDVPLFISNGNPDVMSGTFGLNAYQFSGFLIIIGGYFLGETYIKQSRLLKILLPQIFIFFTFYLMSFRSAVPFFIISYVVLIVSLYGARIWRFLFAGSVIILISTFSLSLFFMKTEASDRYIKYDDWMEIIRRPSDFLHYGKFLAYPQTALMLTENPKLLFLGVGPGNFLSRAYYTFSFELGSAKRDKGVGKIVMSLFNIWEPRFTAVSERYLSSTRTGAVLGTVQLSNPQSSYLAPGGEIGILGGLIIIIIYFYIVKRSYKLLIISKKKHIKFLPLACGLSIGAIYIFLLAFLDNYWEISRVTLPLWILFWAVTNIAKEMPQEEVAVISKSFSVNSYNKLVLKEH